MSEASSYPVGDKSQFYYRHSGRAPLGSLILALMVGVAFAIPAAIAYAAADIYIPFIYARCLLCVALGFVIGVIPTIVMRWGKVR
jgi:hypothetical protein